MSTTERVILVDDHPADQSGTIKVHHLVTAGRLALGGDCAFNCITTVFARVRLTIDGWTKSLGQATQEARVDATRGDLNAEPQRTCQVAPVILAQVDQTRMGRLGMTKRAWRCIVV